MGLRSFFGRADRLVARFNEWIGPTAVATNVQGPGKPPTIDEMSVTVVLGEMQKIDDDGEDHEPPRG